ncbi:MAG: hypothetical protein ROM03_09535 [Mucispirillum sp.]|nr:hypothetical protein [Mucispirillum sp.]
MKKLIFLIPFMLIIYSCADTNSGTVSTVSSDSSGGSSMISQGGSSGSSSDSGTSNPAGDGSAGGNTGETVDTGGETGGNTDETVDTGSETDSNTDGNTDVTVDIGGETGGNTEVTVDIGGETGGNTEVTVDPGGNTGDVVVDVEEPGGGDVVVIIPPSTEDPEYNNFTNTIFDYINRDNLYYRSTLSELEKKVYDRLYDSFQSFYGRNEEESEECTAGVLCHATDVFVTAKCIDDETGFELTNLSQEDKEYCTPEEVQKQYNEWADKHCINSETGEARLNASTGAPVCGEENYNYKYAEWLYRQTTGVPVGFLDMKEIFVAMVFQNYTQGNIMSVNDIIKSIEEKLMLDLNNLYLFKAGGQVSNTKYDLLNYYKIQTVPSFNNNEELKTQWVSQMKQIQERVYYSIKNYTRFKFDTFDDLVYNYKVSSYSKKYNENGADDITGVITEQFNGKGLARLFAFACQISSSFQCAYVEGKANYSTGFGNHGGAEFDHAWVKVKNTFASECSGDIIIDPLRFYEEKETIPYLCMSDAENAGYKPSVE